MEGMTFIDSNIWCYYLDRSAREHDAVSKCLEQVLEGCVAINTVVAMEVAHYLIRNLGKLEEAIEALDKAIEINPHDTDAWYNKSNALRLLGHTREAYEALAKADELKSVSRLQRGLPERTKRV